jgi:hypothetical protein
MDLRVGAMPGEPVRESNCPGKSWEFVDFRNKYDDFRQELISGTCFRAIRGV